VAWRSNTPSRPLRENKGVLYNFVQCFVTAALWMCYKIVVWYSTFMGCPHNFPYSFKDSTSILYCSSKSNKC
jgi:hypothetical protein